MIERVLSHFKPETPSPLSIETLYRMHPLEKLALKREIADHNGRIRIVVHPYFMENRDCIGSHLQKLEAYQDGFERLISSPSKESLPLFIFEEDDSIPRLRSRLKSLYEFEIPKRIVLIPTQPGTPEPRPSKSPWDANPYNKETTFDRHWEQLTKLLKSLGVRSILINGTILTIGCSIPQTRTAHSDSWFESIRTQLADVGHSQAKNLLFGRCVGTTMSILAEHFTIEVSALTFPDNRLTLNHLTKPLGRHNR